MPIKRPAGFAGGPFLFGDSEAGPDAGDPADAAEDQRLEPEPARAPHHRHEAAEHHPEAGAHGDDAASHAQLIGTPARHR